MTVAAQKLPIKWRLVQCLEWVGTEVRHLAEASDVRTHRVLPGSAEAVSKRMLQSRAVEIGLRESPTTASADVGKGKAPPQNLEIYCFDTASPNRRRSTVHPI